MYLGQNHPNDILSGRVDAKPGDSFYCDGGSFGDKVALVAFRFTPLEPGSAEKPHKNFTVLHRGIKAIEAAEKNEHIPSRP
jgi:hypothetical protein